MQTFAGDGDGVPDLRKAGVGLRDENWPDSGCEAGGGMLAGSASGELPFKSLSGVGSRGT